MLKNCIPQYLIQYNIKYYIIVYFLILSLFSKGIIKIKIMFLNILSKIYFLSINKLHKY